VLRNTLAASKTVVCRRTQKKSQETAPQKNSCGKNARKIDFSCKYQGKIQKESSLQKCEKIARNCPPEKNCRANFFCGSPSCDAGGCAS
jgi:hypothetical protein